MIRLNASTATDEPAYRADGTRSSRSARTVGWRHGRRWADTGTGLVVVLVSLTAAWPLFQGSMVDGHDAHEHVTRAAEFTRALRAGVWWPLWSPNLGHGYGEPIFAFNPPLLYYLAALPALAGTTFVWGVNLATAALLAAAGLGTYALVAPIFGRAGGVLGAATYVWAPYMMLDLYVRQALTELTAVCLLPWALWGISRACRRPTAAAVGLGSLAIGLLMLSSTPGVLVAVPALAGQVLVSTVRRPRRSILAAAAVFVIGGLLACAFWLPVLAERQYLRFDRLLTILDFREHFVELWQLASRDWSYGIERGRPNMSRFGFGLGEAQLLVAVAGVLGLALLRRPEARRQAMLGVGLVLGGIFMASRLSAAIWELVGPLQYLQFPWRFLMLPALGCAILAGVAPALLGRYRRDLGTLALVGGLALVVATGWHRTQPRELVVYNDDRFAAEAVARRDRGRGTVREYEPIWVEQAPFDPPSAPFRLMSGAADVTLAGGSAHEQRYLLNVRERTRIRLMTYYFPGWRVWVNGQEREIFFNNRSALIDFYVWPGETFAVASFGPTPPRWAGFGLASIGLISILVLLLRPLGRVAPGRHPRPDERASGPAGAPPDSGRAPAMSGGPTVAR